MKLLDAEEYIADLSDREREGMNHALKNEGIFVVQNAIKMKLFALYRINNITYIDYSTDLKEYVKKRSFIKKKYCTFEFFTKSSYI